jgi:hypothetical protein
MHFPKIREQLIGRLPVVVGAIPKPSHEVNGHDHDNREDRQPDHNLRQRREQEILHGRETRGRL